MTKPMIVFGDGSQRPKAVVDGIISNVDRLIERARKGGQPAFLAKIFFAEAFDLPRLSLNSPLDIKKYTELNLATKGACDFKLLPDVQEVVRTYYAVTISFTKPRSDALPELKIQKLKCPHVSLATNSCAPDYAS